MVLASIEDEFRTLVDHFAGDRQPLDVLSIDVVERVRERRRRDNQARDFETLAQALPYLDFQEAYDTANAIRASLPQELKSGLTGLASRVSVITGIRNRVAHNRPLGVDDLPTVIDFAHDLASINGWDWDSISSTQAELERDPSYIFNVDPLLIADPDTSVAHNLPIPDYDETSLLGRKDERRRLIRALRGAWPVISVLGDGGIGKTALALQVCYDLLEQDSCPFEAIVWVTAKNAQLTSTEIVRIESAVEDSLGLFASAVEVLGGTANSTTAIEELIEVLEAFPTLLVLDNVETILDENFPTLLREIPVGSKVLITSRIGVKTENPYKISGLSVDDAVILLRSLSRARGGVLPAGVESDQLKQWALRMNCHPAYIKWFVAGLQTGQVPEKLLDDDGLVLEYCMSNVFDYLSDTARAALRAMLMVPGSHTMAELAFMVDFDSATVQQVVLDLTTTNFVTQVRSGASGTGLELSEFARAYLRRTLSIDPVERELVTERQKALYAVGGGLRAAHALNPYSPETVDIRGVGDYSAAKLLREALDLAANARFDDALRLCSEAAELAPGYHEAARVEGRIHHLSTNFGEAFEAYSRARDLATQDGYVAYEFGEFLVQSGYNIRQGVRELQRAATLDKGSATVRLAVAGAHISNGDPRSAMDASAYAVKNAVAAGAEVQAAAFSLWRSAAYTIQAAVSSENWADVAEVVESALDATADLARDQFLPNTLDLMSWVEKMSRHSAIDASDSYIARRLLALADQVMTRRLAVDPEHSARCVGEVQNVVDRGFGFLRDGERIFFFHARDMWTRDFDRLATGSVLAFTPSGKPQRDGKPQAVSLNWIG